MVPIEQVTLPAMTACRFMHPHDAPWPHELDISFSTHLTVVVPARLDFAAGHSRQVELVLPRARLSPRRPCLRALLDAAQAALGRTRTGLRPLSLSARIDGQWHALCPWPDAGVAVGRYQPVMAGNPQG